MNINNLLERLAPLKIPLLVFAVMGSIVLFKFAPNLGREGRGGGEGSAAAATAPVAADQVCAVMMRGGGVLAILGTLAFYFWAALKAPSSSQELLFAVAARNALDEHRRKHPGFGVDVREAAG